ncbi:hemin-degrading factor [Paludibacterium purpuratum]|uniref:Putative hemin transport protein n=1 Tax=Paludibacterium purpuratum TaxID=1144873 RepID=A0A4R7B1U7_9NEIS|nr:ChuX/HutX family heme-like substrate-binding protein [Paludibacterium purpuratum]TDR73628.1 putative hemin transport protein [Paludibacterium purpuratum]
MDHATIRHHFAAQRQQAGTRQRDIADGLGIGEAELIAAHVGVDGETPLRASRLDTDWPALFAELASLGEVMALTRNQDCVHEKIGVYRRFSHDGHVGLVLDQAIDLRLFFGHWRYGFAVEDDSGSQPQHSLQFFDAQGEAVHKIFRRPGSDRAAWAALCHRFADQGLAPQPIPVSRPARRPEKPDAQIDVAGLRQGWAALRDTHDFFSLLKRFGVSRRQGLRLADPRFVSQVIPMAASWLLQEAARRGVPIMVFTGNPGTIQIHSGSIAHVFEQGPWINVMDEGFNLHLRQDRVTDAWLVRKPTRDGLVSSLELFNAQGETIAMLFGERKPGRPERSDWRALLDWLQEEAVPCAV